MSDDKDKIAGLPTGEKACFKFMIPSAWAQQVPGVPGLGQGGVKMMQQMGFVPCIKENCSLWNAEEKTLPPGTKGECWEVTRSRAVARIADLKWNEVVGSES